MTSRTAVLAVTVALITATCSTLATPAVAKMPDYGAQYISDLVDGRCMSDEGYARRAPCDAM